MLPRKRVLPVGLALSILLAGCGAQPARPGTPTTRAPTPKPASPSAITVGTIGASGVYTPVWVGVDRGLFDQFGVHVKTVVVESRAAMAAVESGNLDIVVDSEAMVQADPDGRQLVYVGALNNEFNFAVYALPKIQSVADLKGQTVTASSASATTAYAMKNVLEQAGLDPSRDVRWDYTGTPPEQLASMEKGLVAAAVLSAPTTLVAQQKGMRLLLDLSRLHLPGAAVTLVARRAWAKHNEGLLEGFFKGLIRAIAVTRSDPAEAEKVIGEFTKISDRNTLEATYKYYRDTYPDVPYITPQAVAEAIRDVPSPEAKRHQPADYIDSAALDAVVRSGFVQAAH